MELFLDYSFLSRKKLIAKDLERRSLLLAMGGWGLRESSEETYVVDIYKKPSIASDRRKRKDGLATDLR